MERRSFLKGLFASGVVASFPASTVLKAADEQELKHYYTKKSDYQIYRNACPRNCYDTCSIVSYVKNGRLEFLEGAEESTYTNGGLCVKGNSYVRRVYSPERLRTPMLQVGGKGSGLWKRISWDEALERIAKQFLKLKKQDGNLLGACLSKYSGNFDIMHYGIEGMFSSLGYTSRLVGTPCWPAGIDAQNFDMGNMWCNDPEDMEHSKQIILWGVNPAETSIHSFKYIYKAQEKGAKVIVIDPLFTTTAAKADEFVQIRPGTDGALALAMAKHIVEKKLYDKKWIEKNSHGFSEFKEYLNKNVSTKWASELTGVPEKVITMLAEGFVKAGKPSSVWIGYGMQRHSNGGSMVRAIDAFVALTGNIGLKGGGARYGHLQTWGQNYYLMGFGAPKGSTGYTGAVGPMGEFDKGGGAKATYTDRPLNINKTARELLETKSPEINLLWVACKNPFGQDANRNELIKAFKKVEMVVVADQFFNESAKWADIVLPVTTQFEENALNVSYWHYWMSINQAAIKPLFEAKNDIEIACLLSKKINSLEAGSCTFPQEYDGEKFLSKEFNEGLYKQFGMKDYRELLKGPVKAKSGLVAWEGGKFGTPSGKFEFKSAKAKEFGNAELPVFLEGRKPYDALRFMSPHTRFGLHSQFQNLDWMSQFNGGEPFLYINPKDALARGIKDLDLVAVSNKNGQLELKAKVTDNVPAGITMAYEGWYRGSYFNVNELVDDTEADMGKWKTGMPGIAIHDQFVSVRKI